LQAIQVRRGIGLINFTTGDGLVQLQRN
jgi:hypothetical protein